MISECVLEVERLAKELEESREKSSQLEGKLKVFEEAHSLEAARFESRIGELERDLGKTASSLLKAKEAKTAKSSELCRLKRKIKSGEESSVSAVGEAKEAMRAEFKIRLSRISGFLYSLVAVYVRDLALEGVEGGTNEVGEAPQSPRVEGAMLPVRRGELVGAEGDIDLIIADLKSECVPPAQVSPLVRISLPGTQEEAWLRTRKGWLAKMRLCVRRMIEFAISSGNFVLCFFVPAKCGRVFILGLATCGFESPSLLRLLNET